MRLGERRPPVILKLAYLLSQNGQFTEANELLPMLGDPTNSPFVSALQQDVWINLNQLDRAEDLAKQMVDKRAKGDVIPLLCYGQVLMAKNDTKMAEQMFLQALDEKALEEKDDENASATAWMLLYNLYSRTGENSRATRAINEFLKLRGDSISEVDRILTLAQAAEMQQDPQAEALFKEVMQLAPNDLNALYAKRTVLCPCRQIR